MARLRGEQALDVRRTGLGGEIRGHVVDGEVAHFQVTLKVGFRLDDPQP